MNTFDLTIKHNLHVGLTNAINQINHLNTVVLASMNFEESKLTQCSTAVVEQLKNNLEMLSLIEPEGEQWISIDERLPNHGQLVMLYDDGLFLQVFKFHEKGSNGNPEPEFLDLKDQGPISMREITHWRPLPQPPVTLSEASNNNFQQGVPEEFIDQESDVHVNSQPLEFPYDFDRE